MNMLDELLDHLTRPKKNHAKIAEITAKLSVSKKKSNRLVTLSTAPAKRPNGYRRRRVLTPAARLVLSLFDAERTSEVSFAGRTWLATTQAGGVVGYSTAGVVAVDPVGVFTGWLGPGRFERLERGKPNPYRQDSRRLIKSSNAWWDRERRRVVYPKGGRDPNSIRQRGKPPEVYAEAIKDLLDPSGKGPEPGTLKRAIKAVPDLTNRQMVELKNALAKRYGAKLARGSRKADIQGKLTDQLKAIYRQARNKAPGGNQTANVFRKKIPDELASHAATLAADYAGAKPEAMRAFLEKHYDGRGDAREWAGAYLVANAPKRLADWARSKPKFREKVEAMVKGDEEARVELVRTASGLAVNAIDEMGELIEKVPEKAIAAHQQKSMAKAGVGRKQRRLVGRQLAKTRIMAKKLNHIRKTQGSLSFGKMLGKWIVGPPIRGAAKVARGVGKGVSAIWGGFGFGIDKVNEGMDFAIKKMGQYARGLFGWLGVKQKHGSAIGSAMGKLGILTATAMFGFKFITAVTQTAPYLGDMAQEHMGVPAAPVAAVMAGWFLWNGARVARAVFRTNQKETPAADEVSEMIHDVAGYG